MERAEPRVIRRFPSVRMTVNSTAVGKTGGLPVCGLRLSDIGSGVELPEGWPARSSGESKGTAAAAERQARFGNEEMEATGSQSERND